MADFCSRRTALSRAALALGVFSATRRTQAWDSASPGKGLQAFLDGLVEREKFPGVSLAVAQAGRLVATVVSGMADPAGRIPVTTRSLFRVASVSKPLTALVIARLIERGKIRSRTPVHAYLELPPARDPRWSKITVEHCLHHTAGWDRAKSQDPMFRSRAILKDSEGPGPAMPGAIIRYMLDQPLDFEPGTRHAYSNFAYCLLGRVIEKATGLSYEAATRAEILNPLGIGSMRLGRTLKDQRAPGEVAYHDSKNRVAESVFPGGGPVDQPYGAWCLESMDAHGGWLASAADLVRWALILDTVSSPVLLRPDTLAWIKARPPCASPGEKVWYGWGWQIREVAEGRHNLWHTGSLPGTGALLVRRHDDITWALLVNTDANPSGKSAASLVDPMVHQAVDQSAPLPKADLFQVFGHKPAR